MKKTLSVLLFGAMMVGFYACNEPTDPFNGHEYVDLGLPSGTLWATCNVGATNPEDAGDYFAWGETKPKENYNWENEGEYKWGIDTWADNTNYGMTKYNTTDGKTVLEAADDAATANWGDKWHMPTKAEFQELLDECNWKWDTTKRGYTITSKAEGNTYSIFLPAAGFRSGTTLEYESSSGFYWSSSLEESTPNSAYCLGFSESNYNCAIGGRYSGQSVRPVCSPQR